MQVLCWQCCAVCVEASRYLRRDGALAVVLLLVSSTCLLLVQITQNTSTRELQQGATALSNRVFAV